MQPSAERKINKPVCKEREIIRPKKRRHGYLVKMAFTFLLRSVCVVFLFVQSTQSLVQLSLGVTQLSANKCHRFNPLMHKVAKMVT